MKPSYLLLTLLAVAAVTIPWLAKASENSPKPLKILLITGGCCHDHETQKMILADGISQRIPAEFTLIHEGPGPSDKTARHHRVSLYEKEGWAKGYDLVLHNECFGMVDDNAFIERIAKEHHNGVPAVMLHCSTHSYRAGTTQAWRECLGVTSVKHEKQRDLTIDNIAKDHPIMLGFPEQWHNPKDELYIIEATHPKFTALAQSFGEETQKYHPVIWTNEYGKARIFATTLGHNNTTVENPVFLDLITRGILWVTHQDVNTFTPSAIQKP